MYDRPDCVHCRFVWERYWSRDTAEEMHAEYEPSHDPLWAHPDPYTEVWEEDTGRTPHARL